MIGREWDAGAGRIVDVTHAQLVERAARWLRARCPVVITEMAGQSEEPDAIGFKGGFSTLIECKASRSDFFAERRKSRRNGRMLGMGDMRYYMTPAGLVALEECPPGWGLLWINGRGVSVMVRAQVMPEKDHRAEERLLISCLRRLGQNTSEGVAVKVYTIIRESKKRATLGIEPMDPESQQ